MPDRSADPDEVRRRQEIMANLELLSLIVAALILIVLLGTLAPEN